MKVPKTIADKVQKYQKLQQQADQLYKEIKEYFENELEADGFGTPFITDKPKGHLQNDDEYCDQYCIYEDWYQGTYYHQIEGSKKYVGYSFDV